MQLRPRSLVLNILLAAGQRGQAVRELIASCGIFGIRENSVRVALVRLVGEGLVEVSGRGRYRLGPGAAALASDVARWRTAEEGLRPWDGEWVAVHLGPAGRASRAALRARQRALSLLGLRELERGLHVRPDNLEGGVDVVRARLRHLGVEDTAAVFVASRFDPVRERRARGLWDGAALDRGYRATRAALEKWATRAGRLTPEAAAREAFILGNDAIRRLVFDPLLPAPFVDVEARRACLAAVLRHEDAGRALWRRLRLAPDGAAGVAPRSFEFDPLHSAERSTA